MFFHRLPYAIHRDTLNECYYREHMDSSTQSPSASIPSSPRKTPFSSRTPLIIILLAAVIAAGWFLRSYISLKFGTPSEEQRRADIRAQTLAASVDTTSEAQKDIIRKDTLSASKKVDLTEAQKEAIRTQTEAASAGAMVQ